jgi:hypothetical protein
MPRKAAQSVPGSERHRDEARTGGGPRMHGRTWHDQESTSEQASAEVENIVSDAAPQSEGGGEHAGMGRQRKTSGTQGGERRKRTTPVGKGPTKKTRSAKGSQSGHRAKGRA